MVDPSPDGRTLHRSGFNGHGIFHFDLREYRGREAAAGATTDAGPASTSAARRTGVATAQLELGGTAEAVSALLGDVEASRMERDG